MSENQEPKPETPKDALAELAKLAGEAGKSGIIGIGEGLAIDVGRIQEMFFKNLYCQGAVAQFAQVRELLRREYRADNPNPVPNRFCCYAHAIDAQFSTMVEGFALAVAIVATEGKLADEERKKLMHGFVRLFEEACAVAEQVNATDGPKANRPKPNY